MKKYILPILFLLPLSSCKEFLEEKMVSTITQDYFETEKGAEELVVASYNTLRWKYGFMEGPYLFETGTDLTEPTDNNWATISPAVWAPTGEAGSYANNLMGYYATQLLGGYPVINDCNKAIEIISIKKPGKFAADQTYADSRLSEVYFLRAYTYYMLVTQLGDVPMPLKSNNSMPAAFNFPKSTSEQIYRQLIADLRFAHDHLPVSQTERGRITKGATAHLLAKLYLQRAQAQDFGQYRNANGSVNPGDPNAHLGLLYKGKVSTDLDSSRIFATEVIEAYSASNGGQFGGLASDFWDLFKTARGDWSNESNSEIILQASYGNNLDNGRYGMRTTAAFTCDYTNAAWNLPSKTWAYGLRKGTGFLPTDWGYDVFTDKINDSRYEKSFQIEYVSASFDNNTLQDGPGLAYTDPNNKSLAWTAEEAAYFNTKILPGYKRSSWAARPAVAGQRKIGQGDLGLVFLENTKETAIDYLEAVSQPYVLYPRWVKRDGQYLYRKTGVDRLSSNTGLLLGRTLRPSSRKFVDPNRSTVDNHFGTRDVAIFRLAETYLIRAEVYGRQGNIGAAINDINVLRARAAYKTSEKRAEVLARIYPGSEALVKAEKVFPYEVATDTYSKIKVDASYWDGGSAKSKLESYPTEANTALKRFVHFIYNEYSREFNSEQILYEGIHHAGIQLERVLHHNQLASPKAGNWPVADNPVNGNGQNGNGKGVFSAKDTFKPFPQAYINMLTDEKGTALTGEALRTYQNPGYN
ncbi:RagB/SusD family nutrient uptake outer membrane protein [Dyadobacter chenwenxiniae]|uniref:RagB/SusD family nutrient uptake outer membrane protein n=1 Tax=Dyadobacter chenwenxiniae TaxID=2906456 RepID=A0A9X1PL78_9BACT|nr:RagB/SusD family nutrient uptake outer membrane protein [Dyadobacter chenwenxiniae]MCF0062821.1 RagB/SusD family nutrient uptake outer membrane protein [Dyadobacter chenwenxiniae]UON85004.1 RagB/SusD family nutrient uptake outer membrane protein [Dyadobacter chenwenxiniae]